MLRSGRVRQVRTIVAIAAIIWFVAEVGRLGDPGGRDGLLLAQVSVAGIVLCAAATFVAAAHGRMRGVDEWALYLDAAIVALALAAGVLVIGEQLVVDDRVQATLLQSPAQ